MSWGLISRCQGIHHMEDRCQDATEALSQLATAQAQSERAESEITVLSLALGHLIETHDEVATDHAGALIRHAHREGAWADAREVYTSSLSTAATEHDERIRQAALSQFTPERIAEALDGVLPRMAFIQYAEPLYGLDWEPDAYYLRVATEVLAALTEKPQETE